MKKFTVLVALALLAATGTSYAVTCAYDNVPAATLLVPYFKVARNGSTGGDIPEGGVDTLLAVTNVSSTGLIAHVTVWNKYTAAVLDFNIPMTAYDVVYFRMKDILNGKLNANEIYQTVGFNTFGGGLGFVDPCIQGDVFYGGPVYPFGTYEWTRFRNPDETDRLNSISVYSTPAFSGAFRNRVWDSLDESADGRSLTAPGAAGAGVLDVDNPACGRASDGNLAGDFTGYVTIDVVNFCTNAFPNDASFYTNDAIATLGWGAVGGPNVLMGDVFFIDPAAGTGNISGDPMVPVEFDARLTPWTDTTGFKTFYGRYNALEVAMGVNAPAAFRFLGDGREPLGNEWGFRYLADTNAGLISWATIWRADRYLSLAAGQTTLCGWMNGSSALGRGPKGYGLFQEKIGIEVWDNDENQNVTSGGPSGGDRAPDSYVFLETQRIALGGNSDFNPAGFKGGWAAVWFAPNPVASTGGRLGQFNQSWVGIQHTAPGAFVSVGHSATMLDNQFLCNPIFNMGTTGNQTVAIVPM